MSTIIYVGSWYSQISVSPSVNHNLRYVQHISYQESVFHRRARCSKGPNLYSNENARALTRPPMTCPLCQYSCCMSNGSAVRALTDRQTDTHIQTGPIPYPRLLTREGMKSSKIFSLKVIVRIWFYFCACIQSTEGQFINHNLMDLQLAAIFLRT